MSTLLSIILRPRKAERHPMEMLLVGFIYASISILLSLWIFTEYASLVMVFLTVLSCLYVVQGALIIEEKREKVPHSDKFLLKSHIRTLWFFMFLFLGFFLAFTLWTIILPGEIGTRAFAIQEASARQIQSLTGNSVLGGSFDTILQNNLKVLTFSLIFALFYGAGAVFVLAWNASVMGFVIGALARDSLGLSSLPFLFTKYLLHGLPEMLAYFTGALAGGILFIALVRGDLSTERAKPILRDFAITLTLAVILLIFAALLEVYVSPWL